MNSTDVKTDDKYTILIVDDEPLLLKSLILAIQDCYRIRAVKNGKQAIAACQSDPKPDLVLLDVMMPEMDGYQVIQKLRTSPKTAKIPVIFVTALSEAGDEEKGLELGAVDYITKPVNPAIVKARIKTQLELKAARDNLEKQVQKRTQKLIEAHDELKNTYLGTVKSFSMLIEQKDPKMAGHSRRVADKSRKIATEMQLSQQQIDTIFLAGLMARIGTITLPDNMVTHSLFELDKDERLDFIQHIVAARFLLGNIQSLNEAAQLIEYQYEHFNGTGIPHAAANEAIPLGARIIAVVRDFDLLVEGKLFNKSYSHSQAISYIKRNSGNYYDPDVVNLYIRLYGKSISNTQQIMTIGLADLLPGMNIVEVKFDGRTYVRNMEATEEIISELENIHNRSHRPCQVTISI